MKQHKIISRNQDDTRREIIAIDDKGNYRTLHVHRKSGNWQYLVKDDKKGGRIFGTLR